MVLLTKLINGLSEKHYNIFLYAIIISLGLLVGIFSAKSLLLALLLALLIVCFFIFIYVFFKKGILSFQRMVTPLLVVSILFPPIGLLKGIPSICVELIIILGAWALLLLGHFAMWFANFYFRLSKICHSSSSAEVRVLTVALQTTLLACAVYMIPAAVYHSLQLMPILLIFLGLVYSQTQTKGVSGHESS